MGRSFPLTSHSCFWNDYGTLTLKDEIENTDSSAFEIKFVTGDTADTIYLDDLKIKVMLLK